MYIQVDEDFETHPKARKLCRLLMDQRGWSWCISLWRWCTKYHRDGDLTGVDPADVEFNLGWTLDSGVLYKALVAAGFIDITPNGGVRLHDWMEYQGAAIKKMITDRDRMRAGRERRKNTESYQSVKQLGPVPSNDIQDVSSELVHEPFANRSRTVREPSQDGPATSQDGPGSIAKHSIAEHSSEPDSPEPAGADSGQLELCTEPALMTFPCVGRVPEWHLTQSWVDRARISNPAVDVMSECNRALFWVHNNLGNRKTARGMPRFLGGWMERRQNEARRNGWSPSSQQTAPPFQGPRKTAYPKL